MLHFSFYIYKYLLLLFFFFSLFPRAAIEISLLCFLKYLIYWIHMAEYLSHLHLITFLKKYI